MVTVIDYRKHQSTDGKNFFVLILQGGIEMVKSDATGRFYATARKATVSSTFDERTCKMLIGSQFPGKIEKQQCDPYEYTVPDTGEVLLLEHSYTYVPENTSVEDDVFLEEVH